MTDTRYRLLERFDGRDLPVIGHGALRPVCIRILWFLSGCFFMRACKFHFAAQNAPTNPLDSARRGAMLVLIAALMSVFLIALVFTIDVAYMQLVRTQLRVAADASAKAGMEALTRTESVVVARQVMRDVLASNQVAGRALTVQDQDIQFGRTGANPDGSWQFLPNQQPYQAIRVSLGMTEGSGE
ncbi:MAG: pilus assembly protein TadG-related protein [Planctomycetaceae bacterium]